MHLYEIVLRTMLHWSVIEVKVSVCVISDSSRLHEIESTWDTLVNRCSENPFLLSGFIKQFMEFSSSKGWTPLVLVISIDDTIVGVAPLKISKKLGIQFARFLPNIWFSPDFVSDDKYREICLAHILGFLFKTLRCQLVDLTLPSDSPNMQIIERKCKTDKIHLHTKKEKGRRILPIRSTWDEFEASRSANFRRKFKRMERNISRLGSWKIRYAENEKGEFDVIKEIFNIERMSWKERLRSQRGSKADPDLMIIWNGAQYVVKNGFNIKWSAWFLELDGQELAYVLALQYKNVAYFAKTTYDERYERLAPGVYLVNAVIRELFDKCQIRKIDFLTDLPFMQTWTSLCLPRIRITMSRMSVLTALIKFALLSRRAKDVVTLVSKRSSLIADLIGS